MSDNPRKQQLEDLLANDPTNSEWRYMLAMEHVSDGDEDAAVRCFKEIIEATPDYPPAYHQAARSLARQNKIDEAKTMLLKGIPIAQQKGEAHAAGEMEELLQTLE